MGACSRKPQPPPEQPLEDIFPTDGGDRCVEHSAPRCPGDPAVTSARLKCRQLRRPTRPAPPNEAILKPCHLLPPCPDTDAQAALILRATPAYGAKPGGIKNMIEAEKRGPSWLGK